MGVCIDVTGNAVCCPTGMGNSTGSCQRGEGNFLLEFLDSALGFYSADRTVFKYRNTGRIIAAVFQVAQTFQQYLSGLSEATVSNYTCLLYTSDAADE